LQPAFQARAPAQGTCCVGLAGFGPFPNQIEHGLDTTFTEKFSVGLMSTQFSSSPVDPCGASLTSNAGSLYRPTAMLHLKFTGSLQALNSWKYTRSFSGPTLSVPARASRHANSPPFGTIGSYCCQAIDAARPGATAVRTSTAANAAFRDLIRMTEFHSPKNNPVRFSYRSQGLAGFAIERASVRVIFTSRFRLRVLNSSHSARMADLQASKGVANEPRQEQRRRESAEQERNADLSTSLQVHAAHHPARSTAEPFGER
jgi:hypothetical protein